MASLAAPLADGIRRAILLEGGPDDDAAELVCWCWRLHYSLATANRAALHWLDELGAQAGGPLPVAVRGVAVRARGYRAGEAHRRDRCLGAEPGPGRAGGPIVQGSLLGDGPQAPVAVLLETARPAPNSPRSSPTPTASRTASAESPNSWLAQGYPTNAIGERLHLFPLHRPGPPEVHLREDRHRHPWRGRRPPVLRPLRTAAGARQGLNRGRLARRTRQRVRPPARTRHRSHVTTLGRTRGSGGRRRRGTARGLIRKTCCTGSPTPGAVSAVSTTSGWRPRRRDLASFVDKRGDEALGSTWSYVDPTSTGTPSWPRESNDRVELGLRTGRGHTTTGRRREQQEES